MKDFSQKVVSSTVPQGSVGVFFLGQAGFIFKTAHGKMVVVDPYLSDCCTRLAGFKRLMPYIMDAGDIEFDMLIATHAHPDHFDPDSIPLLLSNSKTEFFGALDTKSECERLSLTEKLNFLAKGDSVTRDEVKITALPCDHGDLAPDALGIMLEIDGKKIYIMGDTAFRTDLLENPYLHNVDLLILPINGAFGNLNEEEAAKVAAILTPKLTVPCHYWNFAEHGGNPAAFASYMKHIAPEQRFLVMRQGEGALIR